MIVGFKVGEKKYRLKVKGIHCRCQVFLVKVFLPAGLILNNIFHFVNNFQKYHEIGSIITKG